MTRTIGAIYENGVLRPLQPLEGLAEHEEVQVTVEPRPQPKRHPVAECAGMWSDEDAKQIMEIIEAEFEQVDPDEWK